MSRASALHILFLLCMTYTFVFTLKFIKPSAYAKLTKLSNNPIAVDTKKHTEQNTFGICHNATKESFLRSFLNNSVLCILCTVLSRDTQLSQFCHFGTSYIFDIEISNTGCPLL